MYTLDIWRFDALIEYEYKYKGYYGAKGERRQPKRRRTPEDVARQNLYNKAKKVRHLINANFKQGDYWTTLTEKRGTAKPIGEVKRELKNFLDALKRVYDKAGIPCKYIYRIEIGSRGGIHIHILLNRIDNLDLVIQEKWKHGLTHTELLDDGPYEDLADYIVKQPTEQQKKLLTALGLGDKDVRKLIAYSSSRNLIRPLPETHEVKHHTMRKIYNSDLVPDKGFYIDKDSIRRGINAYTGMSYLRYREYKLKDHIRPEPVKICECPYCHQFTLEQFECRCRFEVKRARRRRKSG